MSNQRMIYGIEVVEAMRSGKTVSAYKYADPTEDGRRVRDLADAEEIASEDPSLLYAAIEIDGDHHE